MRMSGIAKNREFGPRIPRSPQKAKELLEIVKQKVEKLIEPRSTAKLTTGQG